MIYSSAFNFQCRISLVYSLCMIFQCQLNLFGLKCYYAIVTIKHYNKLTVSTAVVYLCSMLVSVYSCDERQIGWWVYR